MKRIFVGLADISLFRDEFLISVVTKKFNSISSIFYSLFLRQLANLAKLALHLFLNFTLTSDPSASANFSFQALVNCVRRTRRKRGSGGEETGDLDGV